jgi:signal transduction histidine kinase
MANQNFPYRLVIEACLVAGLSYLAARLGGALIVRPQLVSPLWLGNVLLVSVLLLLRRSSWPVLLTAGLVGFFLYDMQEGVPIRSAIWLILSNAVEVLIATLSLRSSFDGVPRLNSVKALVKYSFYAVFLAPFVGAFLGALSTSSNYWASWKIAFFSEAIGFLTLMPAILGWAREFPWRAQKPLTFYLEAVALFVALVIAGNLAFAATGRGSPPALLYSLVPLLLWSALRFGSTGVSTSMVAIAFVSIWGAVHGRGPFTEPVSPLINVLSLQLFLFFTAAPFMALAALVEERTEVEQAMRKREAELNEAQHLAKIGSWQWDPGADAVIWSEELYDLCGRDPSLPAVSYKEHSKLYTAESWERLRQAVEEAISTGKPYELDLEMVRSDGTKLWLIARGEAVRDATGRIVQLHGTVQDITERKRAEKTVFDMSGRLITAHEEERARIAREIHDDISQRIAVLEIGLEQFERKMPGLSSSDREQLHNFAQVASEVSTDLHNLSHQLHPGKLDLLGLVVATGGLCRDLSKQHGLEIKFVHENVPPQIPKAEALCLFRIVQEALRNVVKHSKTTEAMVELCGVVNGIELCISDSGTGFNPESAQAKSGLGLISMRERLKLIGGYLVVESEPSRGTRVRVRIPLSSMTGQDTSEQKQRKASA